MASARAVALRQVRSGVRLLTGAWAAGAGIYLAQRILWARQIAPGDAADAGPGGALLSVGFALAALGVALVKVMGTAPLGRLPAPRRAARLRDPYRGAPEVEPVTAAERPLGRLVMILLGVSCAACLLGDPALALTARLQGGRAGSADAGTAAWLAWIAVELSAQLGLAVWAARAAQVVGAASTLQRSALPAAVAGLAVIRSGLLVWRASTLAQPLGDAQRWLMDLGVIGLDLGFALLFAGIARALAAAEADELAAAGAPRGGDEAPRAARPEEAAWREVAGALRSYAAACKARIALIVVGGPLLVMARVLEGGRSQEMSLVLLVGVPVLSAVIGAVMVVSLARLSRIPSGGGDGVAWTALILVLLASLADLYLSSLALDVLAGRAFRAADAAEAMPLVELAAELLSLASPLVLLSLLRRLALRAQSERILRLCNAAWGLIGGMMLSVGVVSALEIVVGVASVTAAEIHGALLLALLALAARVYLRALRDLAAALERHAAGAGEGAKAAAAA